jgi:ATP-dependent DNA helicase RecQ
MARTGQRFGTEHLVNLLCGDETEAILKFGHERLRTFGVGKEHNKNEWRSIFRQLQGAGIIALDIGSYGRWTITEEGDRVLKGAADVELRKEALQPGTKKAARAAANAAVLAEGGSADAILFDALKQRRSELAKTQRVPAYVVFADRTLLDMVRLRPTTMAEMARVHGVGQAKLTQYGSAFLEVIRRHLEQSGDPPDRRLGQDRAVAR